MKYSLSPQIILWDPPSGSHYISLYVPPLVTIQIQYCFHYTILIQCSYVELIQCSVEVFYTILCANSAVAVQLTIPKQCGSTLI